MLPASSVSLQSGNWSLPKHSTASTSNHAAFCRRYFPRRLLGNLPSNELGSSFDWFALPSDALPELRDFSSQRLLNSGVVAFSTSTRNRPLCRKVAPPRGCVVEHQHHEKRPQLIERRALPRRQARFCSKVPYPLRRNHGHTNISFKMLVRGCRLETWWMCAHPNRWPQPSRTSITSTGLPEIDKVS